ncbi:MAG: hypothetical protein JSS99_09230 [Actinobacteria bacterium]|nr:hypothetical protein [Actinomycetota bacterium]
MTRAAARIAAAILLLAALLASGSTPASAARVQVPAPTFAPSSGAPATATATSATATDPNALVTPPSPSLPPPGHRLTSKRAIAIAERLPKIARVRREHPGSYPTAYTKGATQWQVSIFTARDRREIGQVTIDDASGAVLEAWTGYQVPWTMARGYDGAFGRRVNAWYVWIPMCLLFAAPFLAGRRPGLRRWRPRLLHLDLLVLLGFSVSLAFFNAARIGLSTPLVYPLLGYLLVRMLLVARRGERAEPLRLLVPVSWLAVALVFLIGFRVGLNVTNSNVIDVGYSGVVGAHRLVHGQPLYATSWPRDDASGDTYGPANYYAYVPFERIWPWSGRWDDLPAAHAAAVCFDLLTILMLFLLGRRIRGPSLGIVLAYAWAAYPFTLYASSTNSNDALVALLLVVTLLLAGRPVARGASAALAGLTKFAPLALAPLFARMPRDARRGWLRPGLVSLAAYALAFALTAAVALLPVLLRGDWRIFWDHTIGFQHDRSSPFSIWGLWGGLGAVQTAVQAGAVLLALAVGIWPRRPALTQTAACGAAVLIALQLGLDYWFFLYVVWFVPFVLVALLGRYGEPGTAASLERDARAATAASAEAGRSGDEQLLDPVGAQRV